MRHLFSNTVPPSKNRDYARFRLERLVHSHIVILPFSNNQWNIGPKWWCSSANLSYFSVNWLFFGRKVSQVVTFRNARVFNGVFLPKKILRVFASLLKRQEPLHSMLDAWISEGFEANYANLYEACKHTIAISWTTERGKLDYSLTIHPGTMYMGVSKNRGTPNHKYVYGCFHFNRVFHYKPSILGVFPLFLETPICIYRYLFRWLCIRRSIFAQSYIPQGILTYYCFPPVRWCLLDFITTSAPSFAFEGLNLNPSIYI